MVTASYGVFHTYHFQLDTTYYIKRDSALPKSEKSIYFRVTEAEKELL
ncbi:hypothetical protein Cylst_4868 [Cylindrospermum stagnale PCC 7417]|uniref:Uncharacterized protein n=1 Tax=Cylindrospermum stagnale PCC 7417 TaxID=56107 RepID=K9X5K2_9NOST|nr:hypothetical protein Cylst_4868 [Cylindrospermum stagnale PCC 7417]